MTPLESARSSIKKWRDSIVKLKESQGLTGNLYAEGVSDALEVALDIIDQAWHKAILANKTPRCPVEFEEGEG